MKWALSLFLLFFILVGCSSRQAHDETNAVREQTGTTENAKHQAAETESPQPLSSPVAPKEDKVMLDVPLIPQNPELKYGCEVTSLAMVLQHAGIKVEKTELAKGVKKENDPLSVDQKGDIKHWGDPEDGFVGDVTGKNKGYAVHVKPLQELMEHYLPGRTVNLTGKSFDDVVSQINAGKPVVVWTTGDYKLPDRWESWKHGNERIHAPMDLHAVVLVGYEPGYIYVNDPLSEKKGHKVSRETFIGSWNALGKQALSYR